MNIQERIEALETEFAEKIKQLKAEVQREDEFPQDGEDYWYMNALGIIFNDKWSGSISEEEMLEIGNVFKTKQQADFAAEKLKVEAELRKYSRPFNYGWGNYNIILTDNESVNTAYWSGVQSQGSIHFESKEKAQQAINEVGQERIKKYLFGVEAE